jgi:DNA ligase-1
LYDALDRTTSTNAKVAALVAYLSATPPADAAWTLFFLTGRRLKRLLPTRLMHLWTLELTGLPEWIVEESYGTAGDFAEAIALLVAGRVLPLSVAELRRSSPHDDSPRLPFAESDATPFDDCTQDVGLSAWIEKRVLPLRNLDDEERRVRVLTWWSRLDRRELFLLNKLLTGEFRVGMSHTLVVRAVARLASLQPAVVEHRLMGEWEPSAEAFAALIGEEAPADRPSQPYPFCLASPLEGSVDTLGSRDDWLVEWKWDGIRAQVVFRGGQVFLWSRGEELITDRFPEIADAARRLPDGTVLDGEIVAFAGEAPRPFAALQHRIGREQRVREMAADVPVALLVYDLLEDRGHDVRALSLRDRRERLRSLLAGTQTDPRETDPSQADLKVRLIRLSEEIGGNTWDELAERRSEARARNVEGLMLKRWSSPYRTGRKRGDWWKWKIDPLTVDAVLIYAQPGSGRRASLFTDYTFGVWSGDELVPIAKAYSGLSDSEIDELDRWIRRHSTERFGPVSVVEPTHVFELGFERIARSLRHKSGVAVRFPRILRWRRDKVPRDADTLEMLERLIR